MVAVIEVGLVT